MRHQCHSRCLRTSEQRCARSTCAALRDREATLYALDLQCAVGTPVLAIADGKVEKIEQQRFGGGAPHTGLRLPSEKDGEHTPRS